MAVRDIVHYSFNREILILTFFFHFPNLFKQPGGSQTIAG
jgi:hypothetical protein